LRRASSQGRLSDLCPKWKGVSDNPTVFIGLPEGEIRLSNLVGLPPGYRVASLTYGSTNLLEDLLKVSATNGEELHLALVNSAKPVKVSGRIEGADLNTIAKTPVRITMRSPSFVLPLTVDVRSDGTFEFSQVFPGNYRIQAETDPSSSQQIFAPVVVGEKEIKDLVVTVAK
jgi:hypothetical protein